MNLGVALGEEGRTEEEIGRYARRSHPGRRTRSSIQSGRGLPRRGTSDGAIESYRRSLALWPGNPKRNLNLGMALAGKETRRAPSGTTARRCGSPGLPAGAQQPGNASGPPGQAGRGDPALPGGRCGFPPGFHGGAATWGWPSARRKREEAASSSGRRYGCAPGIPRPGKCWRPPWPRSGSNHRAPRAAGETTLAGPAGRTPRPALRGDGQLASILSRPGAPPQGWPRVVIPIVSTSPA